jgi:hypothetical protein
MNVILFRISSILWIIWGLVHILAGVLTMSNVLNGDIAGAIIGIADAVDPAVLRITYPAAAGAVIGQHGFNLFWVGLLTFVAAFYVWKGKPLAIFTAAIVGGLADVGYFLFLDLGGYVNFIPGTLMTLFSAGAIIASFAAHFKNKSAGSQ